MITGTILRVSRRLYIPIVRTGLRAQHFPPTRLAASSHRYLSRCTARRSEAVPQRNDGIVGGETGEGYAAATPTQVGRRETEVWDLLMLVKSGTSHRHENTQATETIKESYARQEILDQLCQEITRMDSSRLCSLLMRARDEVDFDLLSHLGLAERRWHTVAHVVKAISHEHGKRESSAIESLPMATGFDWGAQSLHELTDADRVLVTAPVGESWQTGGKLRDAPSLNGLEAISASPNLDPRKAEMGAILRAGLGQVWQSLGNMVIQASLSPPERSAAIMPHILQALAMLHQHNVISDLVYHFSAPTNSSLLRQPPTLYLLSRKIFTLLANAAFEVQEPSSDYSEDILMVPYKVPIDELGPELWLELILWSCLHGDWIENGAAILQKLAETNQWSLLCWGDILASADNADAFTNGNWAQLDAMLSRKGMKANEDQRRLVDRTVSSELVAAYVDGLTDCSRSANHYKGLSPADALRHIKLLKQLLDKQSLGLGYTTWDAICLSFLEAEGFDISSNPRFVVDLMELIQPFGRELQSDNLGYPMQAAETVKNSTPAHLTEASAAALGILHQAIDACADQGDVEGALEAFGFLQRFTDENKRKSVEAFFSTMKTTSLRDMEDLPSDATFTSNTSAMEYPSFYPQLPSITLSKLLNMVSDARMFDFGNWMLFSDDVDGRLISTQSYEDPVIAAAVIRYATISRQKKLLSDVLTAQATVQSRLHKKGLQLPPVVLQALLESQIDNRLWDSAKNILRFVGDSDNLTWEARTIVSVAKQVLQLQHDLRYNADTTSLGTATQLMRSLLGGDFGDASPVFNEINGFISSEMSIHSIVGLLSSIDKQWAVFCNDYVIFKSGSQPLRLPVESFNTILDVICETRGVDAGKRFWNIWCRDIFKPKKIPIYHQNHVDDVDRVILEDVGHGELVYRTRIEPNLASVRIVLRHVLALHSSFTQDDEVSRWALKMLGHLTKSKEDRDRELRRSQGLEELKM